MTQLTKDKSQSIRDWNRKDALQDVATEGHHILLPATVKSAEGYSGGLQPFGTTLVCDSNEGIF